MYQNVYLFNLTNPDDVLQGGSPVFQEIGPYVYRIYRQKLKPQFLDDGNQVSNYLWRWFVPEPSKSNGSDVEDVVTNVNPAYMGVVFTAQGEEQMKLGFCGPLTNIFFNWMDTSFRNQVFFEYNPDILEHAESLLTHNSSRSDFLSNWANATRNVSSSSWAGMTISKNNASEIAMSKASLLWNASVAYSLLNQTLNS